MNTRREAKREGKRLGRISRNGKLRGGKMTLLRASGTGAIFVWTNVTFFSKLIHYSTRNSISHLNSTYAFMCLGGVLILVAVVALRFLRAKKGAKAGGQSQEARAQGAFEQEARAENVAALVSAVVLSAATVLLVMIEHRLFTQPWCSIISTLSGAALAMLSLCWAASLAGEDSGRLPWTLTIAFAVGAAAQLLILSLPSLAGVGIMTLLPIASYALLRLERRMTSLQESAQDQTETQPLLSWSDLAEAKAGRDPSRYFSLASDGSFASSVLTIRRQFGRAILSLGLLAFSESFARALFMTLTPATETSANHWVLILAAMFGALLFAFGSASSSGKGHEWRLSRLCCTVMVTLLALAPITRGIWLLPDLVTLTCYYLVTMLAWVVLVRMAREWRMDVRDTFAPGMAAVNAGALAGTFLGSVLVSFLPLGERALSLLAVACIVLTMVSLLFLLDDRAMVELINASRERPVAPRRFALRVEEVARDAGLTPRETQVLALAAKGRTMQRIQEELGISAGTANTHLNHVYRKLGVHDRQEMLDLLERKAS